MTRLTDPSAAHGETTGRSAKSTSALLLRLDQAWKICSLDSDLCRGEASARKNMYPTQHAVEKDSGLRIMTAIMDLHVASLLRYHHQERRIPEANSLKFIPSVQQVMFRKWIIEG